MEHYLRWWGFVGCALVLQASGSTQRLRPISERDRTLDVRPIAKDLSAVSDSSNLIVAGTVRGNSVGIISDDLGSLLTYDVDVDEVFKGAPPERLVFVVATTTAMFANANRRYVLFLKRTAPDGPETARPGGGPLYQFAYGAQGVFDISGATVRSMARNFDTVWRVYDGSDVLRFLQTVRSAAAGVKPH